MTEFDIRHVERGRSFLLCCRHHRFGRNEKEFGLRIDELLDEPGTSDPVHFHSFACDPFHGCILWGIIREFRCCPSYGVRDTITALPSSMPAGLLATNSSVPERSCHWPFAVE